MVLVLRCYHWVSVPWWWVPLYNHMVQCITIVSQGNQGIYSLKISTRFFLQVFTFEFSLPSSAASSPVRVKPSAGSRSVSESSPIRTKPPVTPSRSAPTCAHSEFRRSLSSPASAGGYHLQAEGGARGEKEVFSGKGPKPHAATSLSTSNQTKSSVHKPVACRVTRHSPPTARRDPAPAPTSNTNIQHSSPKSDTHARPTSLHRIHVVRRERSESPSHISSMRTDPPSKGVDPCREGSRSPSSHPGPHPAGHTSRFETFLSKKPPLPVFTGISAADSESIYDIPWTSYPRPSSIGLNKSQSLKQLNGEVGFVNI